MPVVGVRLPNLPLGGAPLQQRLVHIADGVKFRFGIVLVAEVVQVGDGAGADKAYAQLLRAAAEALRAAAHCSPSNMRANGSMIGHGSVPGSSINVLLSASIAFATAGPSCSIDVTRQPSTPNAPASSMKSGVH